VKLREKEYDRNEFQNVDFRQYDLTDCVFETCTFIDCTFSGAALTRARFADCGLTNCDLSNAKLLNAKLTESSFTACKLLGINWSLTEELRGPRFDSCNLSLGSFRGRTLKNVAIVDCRVHEADFQETDLSGGNFSRSDFAGTLFNQCSLLKADFRSARNYQIDPLTNKVKGAKFSLPEAVGLLTGFGIVLDDFGSS
jgi:fluoroquinolone resistance protein